MYLHCLGCQAKEYDYNLCAECYRCASHGLCQLSAAFLCLLLVLGSWAHGTLCMLTTLGFVRRSRRHATDEKHHHRSHRFQLRWRYSQPDDVQKLAQEYADMPVD